jgi:hypothetical protein
MAMVLRGHTAVERWEREAVETTTVPRLSMQTFLALGACRT